MRISELDLKLKLDKELQEASNEIEQHFSSIGTTHDLTRLGRRFESTRQIQQLALLA